MGTGRPRGEKGNKGISFLYIEANLLSLVSSLASRSFALPF